MSSEIQFGELQQAQPDKDVRPDRDAHYCVLPVGDAKMPGSDGYSEDNLMIFVDLDAMRDMEAHAQSDMSVELGGIMLGRQSVDRDGRPFVVVTDSLRAEHYHATKGSFTFTHDTWSRITEKRKKYRPDLEMVGWYHTHPGWTVFLSGMDLFICNNFFNKPLDVALVIDPVSDDRGWFQWTTGKTRNKRPTPGFYLMANRHRQDELKYFASLYSGGKPMNVDPRYSGNTFSGSSPQPVVNIMENSRRPLIDVAIVAMLTVQFLLLGILAWRMMSPPAAAEADQDVPVMAATQQAQADVLASIVAAQTGDQNLAEKFTELSEENHRLYANLDGQIARADSYQSQLNATTEDLDSAREKNNELVANYNALDAENKELEENVERLEKIAKENGIDPELASVDWLQYLLWVVFALIGGGLGFLFGRRNGFQDEDVMFDDHPADEDEMDTVVASRSRPSNRM
ncbi:MAG: Mov34/MPN/PAD-1 family protein [Planctomycetota bacterium]